ncbi:MAG: CBS domain-containing protein [Candidatus Loosdrechtia sp.]|uniref:CBS domain-containing protein n=1 Tax=Candidatus Loosdrechtia sp. TaxID=3101272 RepID=UPI003A676AC6|nr:MAG: CBS domain-containing protein [Candidatus Jettenia sp. AMX2]
MAAYKLVAKDLMTKKVVCVYPETPVRDLIKIFIENQIDGVPVINKEENLIGVVSKTDILKHIEKGSEEIITQDIMTTDVFTAEANDTLDYLTKKMYQEKIHRIIIQEGKQVIGIVSVLDILHVISTLGYGSVGLLNEDAILDLRKGLETVEKSIHSLRTTLDKIYGPK